MRRSCLAAMLWCGLLAHAQASRGREAQPVMQEWLVSGTILSAKAEASLIVIRQENFLGRMRFQSKSYRVRQPSTIAGLRPGDRILAVYSRKDGLLHRVKAQPPRGRTP